MSDTSTAPRSIAIRWLGAFGGFYRPSPTEIRSLDPVSRFLYAARTVILVISTQAALIAGLLAATSRQFHPFSFLLVLGGFLTAHILSNLSNDYFGYKRGHDTPDSPRMRYTLHPLASGILGRRVLATGLGVVAAIGIAIAVFFLVERGILAAGFLIAGVVLLFAYDAAPVPLKSIGLGEIAVFLVWGPLMVGGGYAMITGKLAPGAFYVSIPYGLGVMSILVGKHIDQRDFDQGKNIHTLPVLFGDRIARAFDYATITLMYGATALLIAFGFLTPFCAVVALALPRGLRALRALRQPRPASPPAGYTGWPLWYHRACLLHNRTFGWLYIGGLAAGVVWPHVRL